MKRPVGYHAPESDNGSPSIEPSPVAGFEWASRLKIEVHSDGDVVHKYCDVEVTQETYRDVLATLAIGALLDLACYFNNKT